MESSKHIRCYKRWARNGGREDRKLDPNGLICLWLRPGASIVACCYSRRSDQEESRGSESARAITQVVPCRKSGMTRRFRDEIFRAEESVIVKVVL
ncbi:hypothetical protein ElyMa_006441400 [Elysia marginata]|uniref:Uncharacterized protein n=1 Tax=Elysia marginata TaxID=1093978 RepID=A0AAV4HVN7_9GAST|nr:hypothetical protein ElyMa_006441400 [Elysia marginata]